MNGSSPVTRTAEPTPVGVRELRQHLSVYLRRIRDGESFIVTERGTPVAQLSALPPSTSIVDRLVASGQARSPQVPGGVAGVVAAPRVAGRPSISTALEEQRADCA